MNADHAEELGHWLVARRVALGYKRRIDLANAIDITERTLADIEKGVRTASAGTYAILENALKWKPGSIATILEGGEPTEIYEPPETSEQSRGRYTQMPTDELITEVGEMVGELRRRLPGPSGGGDYPKEAPPRFKGGQGPKFRDDVADDEGTSLGDGEDRGPHDQLGHA